MNTRRRPAKRSTILNQLRCSRSIACTTLFTTLLSIAGPLLPRTALAQSAPPPTNPGNSGASLGPSNTGVQQGQTDLSVPETGPAAALQADWNVDPSTGAFSAAVPFLLPQARGAVQPTLALVYSSSGGQGAGGLGWSLNLPAIERHNPSGLPQYNDPARGAPINVGTPDAGAGANEAEDWFTYGGRPLVPICFIGGRGLCSPIAGDTGQLATETMPTWATEGWHYYRLEVETGSNLRFFWSPSHQTWVVQEPSGATMEFGVPQDNAGDTGGIDIDAVATADEEGDAGTGLPAVFRWNLVRHYDAQRSPVASYPSNNIVYSWSRLPVASATGGNVVGTSPISDLTDIYDTPPLAASYQSTTAYAHHTHLSYNTSYGSSSTRVDRARHTNYLTGVDVTSQTFAGGGPREQVRRYLLSYTPEGHQVELSQVKLDGWCSSGDPTENATTGLLPPEPASGSPACGAGPSANAWPPATTFTYSRASFAPTYTTLPTTFNARPPTPPAIFDLNSDGLPDLIDDGLGTQIAYLNSAPPATALNTWTQYTLTLNHPGTLGAVSVGMQPFIPNYASAAILNGAQVNGLWFESSWTKSPYLSTSTTAGVYADVYSPQQTSASTYDWGVPTQYAITSVFPGCLQNCGQYFDYYGDTSCTTYDECLPGSMFLGCDQPFTTIDVNGDGLQDLLVTSVYGNATSADALGCTSSTSTYTPALNVKLTQRAPSGVVTPFAGPAPQETVGICPFSYASTPGTCEFGPNATLDPPLPVNADQPNVCVGGVGSGANPLLTGPSTFADINGDGLPDIVALFNDHFTVWYGHGDGVFGVCADGTTECACSQAQPTTFWTTATNSEWDTAWSPLGHTVIQTDDPKLNAQFHDVDGDGFDDAIVPSNDGFDVYFVVSSTGSPSHIHVSVLGAQGSTTGFGWPIVNQPGYPVSVDGGLGTLTPDSDSSYMFADMDGSGVDDVLIENPSGQIGYVNVLGGERPGLLTGIQTANGVATTVTYEDLPTLSRQAATRWSLQSPQSTHVVTNVTVADTTPGVFQPPPPVVTQYTYSNPVYDARDRQFVGFTTVEAVNVGDTTAPSMHTKTTFYQGYCNDNTAYPCPTTADYPNHALRGLPILTETYGDQTVNGNVSLGAALATVHRTFQEASIYAGMDGRNVHHTDLRGTDTYWYDNSAGSVVRSTATSENADIASTDTVALQAVLQFQIAATNKHTYVQYLDNDVWGMSGVRYDYGQPDDSNGSLDGMIIDTLNASVIAQDTTNYWTWRPTSVTTQGTPPSSGVYTEARTLTYAYDSHGNLTTVTSPAYSGGQPMARSTATMPESADGGAPPPPGAPASASQNGSNIVVAQLTVDPLGSGNVTRVQQPSTSRCRDVTYDTAYSQLVTGTTTHVNGCADVGLVSVALKYARGLGLVTESSAPDGQEMSIQYEPYGRVQSVKRPSPSIPGAVESFAGITVSYGDTLAPREVQTTVTDGAANTLNYWSVLDGYGRSMLNVRPADTSAGDAQPYILSGQLQRNARGGVRSAYPGSFTANWSATSSGGSMLGLDPSGPARTLQYDAFGRVTAVADLDGTPILGRKYQSLGYVEQDADQLAPATVSSGMQTTVTLDGHGRTTEVGTTTGTGNGAGVTTAAIYLPTGEPWILQRFGVDASGNPYSYERWMYYDSLGRMVVNAEPATSTGFYAPTVSAGPSQPPATLQAWAYAYDDAGDLVATTDARGCGKDLAYDGAGRVLYEDYVGCTSSQAAYTPPNPATGAGTEAFYKYDPLGHLADTYDRAAHTHYGYDARSRVASIQRNIVEQNQTEAPSTPVTGYAPHTFERDFTYDDFNRLTGQTTGEEDVAESIPYLNGVSVPFGSFGSTASTSASAVLLQYSQRGVLKAVGGSYGPLVSKATYDPNGLPLTRTWGDLAATQTSFTYDGRLRLKERKTSRTAPSLWSTASGVYVPPAPGTTTPLLLEEDLYTLDPVGNPATIADGRNVAEWPATAQPVTRALGYDPLYRTTGVTYSYPGSNSYASPTAAATATESPFPLQDATARIGSETSAYDPFGNRMSSTDETGYFVDRSLGTVATGTLGSSAATTMNRVESAGLAAASGGSLTTTYDAAGNLARLNVLRDGNCESSVGCNQLFDYEWDEVGRLARARRYDFVGGETCHTTSLGKLGGTVTICDPNPLPRDYAYPALPPENPDADVTFAYDAGGNRVVRTSTVYASESTESAYTVDVFPSLRLADTTFGTQSAGDYDRSAETDQVSLVAGGGVAGRVVYAPDDPETSANVLTGQHVFLELTDHLGSTTTVIDQATSELVERTTYSAFGRVESDYKPARWQSFREPFKFTGKEDDVALGVTYFGARFYSPYLGTWMSPDPLTIHGLGSDLNPYAYVRGHTMSATDPLGLDCGGDGMECPQTGSSAGGDPQQTQEVASSGGGAPALGNALTSVWNAIVGFFSARPSAAPSAPSNPGSTERTFDVAPKEWDGTYGPEGPSNVHPITTIPPLPVAKIDNTDALIAVAPIAMAVLTDGVSMVEGGAVDALSMADTAAVQGMRTAQSAPRAYSVAFEASLTEQGVGTYGSHFADANEQLLKAMADPETANALRSTLGTDFEGSIVSQSGAVRGVSPSEWSWHHVPDQPGLLQLVPRFQHAPGSAWQGLLHPGGVGGMSIWGSLF
jgi:RHS repeat-associated protein